MKKIITLAMAMFAILYVNAQDMYVATLTSGNTVSQFYGTTALKDAFAKANHGDVINLSGGTFQIPTSITKAVTIKGAGADKVDGTYLVSSSSYFNVNIPQNNHRLYIEGIRFSVTVLVNASNVSDLVFFRNVFDQYVSVSGNTNNSIQFVNCKLIDLQEENNDLGSATLVNCYVKNFYENGTTLFVNSIVKLVDEVYNSTFTNCIIYNENTGYYLNEGSTAINCVAFGNRYMLNNCAGSNNTLVNGFSDVFATFTGAYSDAETFALTPAAQTAYKGTDGTQVGLYGGFMPFTLVPSYPRITKLNVANKTTEDGKLSVEVQVSAGE